jgi:hypothetical protein
MFDDAMAQPFPENTPAAREAAYAETQRGVAQYRALHEAGRKRGMSDEDMDILYHASRGRESPHRPSDPERIGKLAADIYKLVSDRQVLIAEGILATYLALSYQTRNCTSEGCRCGEMAHERASKEMRGPIGDASIKLMDMELERLGW